MADVYSASHVTISALEEGNSHSGMLNNRDGQSVKIPLAYCEPSMQNEASYNRPRPRTIKETLTNATLNQRARILQERILAPATALRE